MAVRTGTCVGFELIRATDARTPADSIDGLYHGVLYVQNNTASTVIGATDTLAFNGKTAIEGMRRNGKTVTLRGVNNTPVQNAVCGTTAYSALVTRSTATISLDPVAESDYSTGATLPANTTVTNRPYGVAVCWTEA
jgi:hypothetical protein